jgi:DNA-binding Lrp family transcriptional regulator
LHERRPAFRHAARELRQAGAARVFGIDKGIEAQIYAHSSIANRAAPFPQARLPAPRDFAALQVIIGGVRRFAMVPFFVQIKCQLGKSYEVANKLADAEIASEIYSTAGEFDLLAKFYVEEGTDIGHFVNEKVQIIPGIQDTRTIITFKAFGA